MKLGIMQPYFLPYIGYWQLMNAVDEFVVYDNIEYTKKGWINRNRMLHNGRIVYFTVPLQRGSDYLDVQDRYLAATWPKDRVDLLNRIKDAYRRAPCFSTAYPVIEQIFNNENRNLFHFIYQSIQDIARYLCITTPLRISSVIPIGSDLEAVNRVLAICQALRADMYINPIGGSQLYDRRFFKARGIELRFIKPDDIRYNQYGSEFAPALSILDVMMFNSVEAITQYLSRFKLE